MLKPPKEKKHPVSHYDIISHIQTVLEADRKDVVRVGHSASEGGATITGLYQFNAGWESRLIHTFVGFRHSYKHESPLVIYGGLECCSPGVGSVVFSRITGGKIHAPDSDWKIHIKKAVMDTATLTKMNQSIFQMPTHPIHWTGAPLDTKTSNALLLQVPGIKVHSAAVALMPPSRLIKVSELYKQRARTYRELLYCFGAIAWRNQVPYQMDQQFRFYELLRESSQESKGK